MPNEPAEDRSVRGNTIKPAKVEPEQRIETEYLDGSLGLKQTTLQDITVGDPDVSSEGQNVVDTGISQSKAVFSLYIANSVDIDDTVFHGTKVTGMNLSGFANELQYATAIQNGNHQVILYFDNEFSSGTYNIYILHE